MEREYTKEKPTKDGHYWLKLDGKEELVELKNVNGALVEVREKRKSLGLISNPACLYSQGEAPETEIDPVEGQGNPGGADPKSETKPPETANENPPKEGEAQSETEKTPEA